MRKTYYWAVIGSIGFAIGQGVIVMWPEWSAWTWWYLAAAMAPLLLVPTIYDRRRVLSAFLKFKWGEGDGFVSLADAMVKAWKIQEIRRLPEFENLARERPQDVYRRLAELIFDGGDPSLSIRGVVGTPPLEQTVEELERYTFSDDLTEMNHITGDGRCYRELRVRWSDVERSIRHRTGAES